MQQYTLYSLTVRCLFSEGGRTLIELLFSGNKCGTRQSVREIRIKLMYNDTSAFVQQSRTPIYSRHTQMIMMRFTGKRLKLQSRAIYTTITRNRNTSKDRYVIGYPRLESLIDHFFSFFSISYRLFNIYLKFALMVLNDEKFFSLSVFLDITNLSKCFVEYKKDISNIKHIGSDVKAFVRGEVGL